MCSKIVNRKLKGFVAGLAVLFGIGICDAQSTSTTSAPATLPVVSKSNILSAVPSEAWVVIVVNDLAKTSTMLDTYASQLGTDTPALQRRISKMLGVSGQLESSKPMVIVVMSKELYGEQPVAVVLSIKDYDSFVTRFAAKATETPGMMKGENEEIGQVYFIKKGPFVVMGPTEAIVLAIANSKQPFTAAVGTDSEKLMRNSEVYIRVNIQSLSQFVKPLLQGIGAMIQMGGMGAMGGMGQEEGQGPNQQTMAQMQAAGVMINVLVSLLDELNGYDLGLKFTPDVIHASSVLSFKSGLEMAGLLAAQKQTDKSLLKGLPGGEFGLAMGYQWQPKMTKFQETIMQIAPPFTDPNDTEKYKAIMKQSMEIGTGSAIKIDFKQAKPGEPMIGVYVVLDTKNSKKYLDILRQSLELQNKMKMPTTAGQEIKMQYKYETAVAKVGEVQIDQVSVDINKFFNMPGMPMDQMKQAKGFLSAFVGNPSGMIQFKVAAVNDKQVVFDFGSDHADMERFVKVVQGGDAPLGANPTVMQTAKLLPKERFMEGYVDLGQMINAVMPVVMGLGGDQAMTATTKPVIKTPLIGLTGSIKGSDVEVDAVVPFETIVQLSALKNMVPTSRPMKASKTPIEASPQ